MDNSLGYPGAQISARAPQPPPVQAPPPYVPPTPPPPQQPQPQPVAAPPQAPQSSAISDDEIDKKARMNGFIASLINLGTTVAAAFSPGGGRAVQIANNPNAGEQARQNTLREYADRRQRAQQEEQGRRQSAIQTLAAQRAQSAEGRAAGKEQRESTEFAQRQELRDPNSKSNLVFRSQFSKSYPELAARLSPEEFNGLTKADIQNDPVVLRALDDLRKEKESKAASDTRMSEWDRKKDYELKKAALQGRGLAEARRALGEESVAHGGYKDPAEAIRQGLISSFEQTEKGFLDKHPDVMSQIQTIRGENYSRGTPYAQTIKLLDSQRERVEKQSMFKVPGWDRANVSGDIQPTEAAAAREASAAYDSIRRSVNRLKALRDKMTSTLGDTLKSGASIAGDEIWVSDDMAEALGQYEIISSNLRKINEYGAPQEHEMVRLEMFMPRLTTVQGFTSGIQRYEGLLKAVGGRLESGMKSKGYKKAETPGGTGWSDEP